MLPHFLCRSFYKSLVVYQINLYIFLSVSFSEKKDAIAFSPLVSYYPRFVSLFSRSNFSISCFR